MGARERGDGESGVIILARREDGYLGAVLPLSNRRHPCMYTVFPYPPSPGDTSTIYSLSFSLLPSCLNSSDFPPHLSPPPPRRRSLSTLSKSADPRNSPARSRLPRGSCRWRAVPGCRGYIPPASAGSDYEGESRRNVGATTLARDRTRTHTHTHTVRGGTRGVPEERLAPLFTWCDFTSRGNVDAGRPGYFYAERSSAGTGPSEHGERRASGRSFVRPPAMNLLLCYYCFGRAAHAPCTLPLRLPAAAAAAASRRPRPSPRPPARVNKPLTHGSPANR